MDYRIFPPDDILQTTVDLPYSKSMSARALIINTIGGHPSPDPISDSDDTTALRNALTARSGTVDIGPAGTAMRFLTAYYAATEGCDVVLTGSERMKNRPIGILVEALRSLGADITYGGKEGFPPLHIRGRALHGGNVNLDPNVSSQFVSALMMIAPLLDTPLSILFDGEPTSLPYIKMTMAMMAAAGVETELAYGRIAIPNTPYTQPVTKVERDWSAASYWYSVSALSAGWVTLPGLTTASAQGDVRMMTYGLQLGVTTEPSEEVPDALELAASPEQHSRISADMADTPDLVQTVAIAAAALGIPFRFTGVHTLRNKETDRLEALRTEALKLGLIFEIEGDKAISWEGARVPVTSMPEIDTYHDHRMAMAFAPVAIFVPGIVIKNVEVVSKSYPRFWDDLRNAGFTLEPLNP